MIQSVFTPDSAVGARRILDALRDSDRTSLGPELDRMKAICGSVPAKPGVEAERWELLEGIVEQMRDSLTESGRWHAPDPGSMEVYVRLLEHLRLTPPGSSAPLAHLACDGSATGRTRPSACGAPQ